MKEIYNIICFVGEILTAKGFLFVYPDEKNCNSICNVFHDNCFNH